MKMQICILLCCALAGCATAPNNPPPTAAEISAARAAADRLTDQQAFAAARAAVLAALKDADSAKFGTFTRKKGLTADGRFIDTVCGTVNAKNSFGGYTGAEQFQYLTAGGSPLFDSGIVNGVDIGLKGLATSGCARPLT